MTVVVASTMTRDQAERLTERIRLTATSFMETRDKLARLIREAQDGEAHKALGIASWTEYVSQVFSDTPLMQLTRDQRRELVSELADEGMSTRAIAPIVGASHMSVARDLDSPVTTVTPAAEPRRITGRDGKTYTRHPAPTPADHDTGENADDRKPKAEAITAQFNSAVVDLNRLMDRLHRITEQDAYTRNADKIATLYKADIDRAISDLTHIANTL